jgi:hypothetical protein
LFLSEKELKKLKKVRHTPLGGSTLPPKAAVNTTTVSMNVSEM